MIAISAGGAINAQRHAGLDNVLGDQYKDRRDPAILYELSKAVQVQRGTAYEGRDGDRVLTVVVVVVVADECEFELDIRIVFAELLDEFR